MSYTLEVLTALLKKPFIYSLGISLLLHGAVIFFQIPKGKALKVITAKLGFRPSRYTIKSVLTKDPIKKIVPKTKKTKPVKSPKKEDSAQEVKEVPQKKVADVKSFEDSIIKNTPPIYPRIAKKRGLQGDVELLILIAANGTVKDIKVLSTNAHEVLVKSALKSASTWLFNPSGNKLSYQVKKTLKYRLE